MPPRFFCEQPISKDSITIEGDEVKHIVGAYRLGVGDDIVLFDGSGDEFLAKIKETKKKSVLVSIMEQISVSRELPFELTLAVALPKGDRQKVLVEKLVELGVTRLIPVNCHRSVAIASEKSVQRLDRRVIEASKQCGRNQLMEISHPVQVRKLFSDRNDCEHQYLAHPYNAQMQPWQACNEFGNQVMVCIGPEGGFTDEEVAIAIDNGWKTLSLTSSILRVETAAVAVAALFGMSKANN